MQQRSGIGENLNLTRARASLSTERRLSLRTKELEANKWDLRLYMYIICTVAALNYGRPALMEPRRCLYNMWENTRNLFASRESTSPNLLAIFCHGLCYHLLWARQPGTIQKFRCMASRSSSGDTKKSRSIANTLFILTLR